MADEINTTVTDEPIESVTLTEVYIEYPNGELKKAKITLSWTEVPEIEEGDEE